MSWDRDLICQIHCSLLGSMCKSMGTCCVGSEICKKCRESVALCRRMAGETEGIHESGESSPETTDSYESVSVEIPEPKGRPPPPPPSPLDSGSSPSPARRPRASPTRGRSPNRSEAHGHRSPSPGGWKGKGKGKGKGKPAAKCKFCWKRAGDYESAVSQHTYWSQNCIAWQYHLQGYPWNQAEELAAQTKARRIARFEAQTPWHTGSSSWREAPAEPAWRAPLLSPRSASRSCAHAVRRSTWSEKSLSGARIARIRKPRKKEERQEEGTQPNPGGEAWPRSTSSRE